MELTIEQLIKIVLGVLVIVAVIVGISIFFKNSVIDFFNNMVPNQSSGMVLSLLK